MSEEKQEQLITLCLKHKEALEQGYILTEIPGSFGRGKCCEYGAHYGKPSQYAYISKRAIKQQQMMSERGTASGSAKQHRDRRARYRPRFREEDD